MPIAPGAIMQGNATTDFDPFEHTTGSEFGIGNALMDFDGFA